MAQRHLVWLANSLLAQPAAVRYDTDWLMEQLRLGNFQLYEWDRGCMLLSRRLPRLLLEAFCTEPGISRDECRSLLADVTRLAADWECDAIETNSYDTRFANVIKHLGGSVESQTLVMEVPDGRE
jgi:hypothetical protein